MPLAKLTLPTALPTVRQMMADLGKAARDAAPLPGLEVVTQGLERLEEYCGRKPLDVELVVVAPLAAEAAERAAVWLGQGFPAGPLKATTVPPSLVDLAGGDGAAALSIRVRSLDTGTAVAAGTPRPAILVLVVGSPAALEAETLVVLEPLLEDRPRVFLIGPVAEPALKPLEERARAGAWTCGVVDLARFPETTLAAHLASSPWDAAQELFRAYSAAAALDSLAGVFGLWAEQQGRDMRIRRAATQAKLGGKPSPTGKAPAASPELLADIKARIQRHSQEFERGAGERLQDLLSVPAGNLARECEALLLGLDELAEEVKTTKIETRLPEAFLQRLLKTVRERIARHCAADLVALNDLFRLLTQEIEREMAQAQGPPFVPQFAYLTEDRVRRVLDMTVALQVQYRGELPQQGFSEYFASVRKYSMILVMAASMFGMSSLMRQYREITVPLTILLVLGGTYSVVSSTRRERVENLEKELDAARNALRPELKRIFNEVQKTWSGTLLGFMNEQIGRVVSEVDATVKEHLARRGAEANPERERLQRQLAQLDASEKRLALVMKARDGVAGATAQARGEMRGLVPRPGTTATAPGLAKPAAPAAAATGMAALQEARAKAEAIKAQTAAPPAAPSAASSALEAAKAKMEALRAASAERAAAAQTAKPSAVEEAKSRFAALKASAAEHRPAEAAKPPETGAPGGEKAAAAPDPRAKLQALMAQAAARKAAAAATTPPAAPPPPPSEPSAKE